MGEAKIKKENSYKITDAELEQQIERALQILREAQHGSRNPKLSEIILRIYGHIFPAYERAMHEEKRRNSETGLVISTFGGGALSLCWRR